MSAMRNIDVETVEAVLLADGWHDVIDASFDVDFYEFNESAGFIFNDAPTPGGLPPYRTELQDSILADTSTKRATRKGCRDHWQDWVRQSDTVARPAV
jgi:hypothetical protein